MKDGCENPGSDVTPIVGQNMENPGVDAGSPRDGRNYPEFPRTSIAESIMTLKPHSRTLRLAGNSGSVECGDRSAVAVEETSIKEHGKYQRYNTLLADHRPCGI